MEIVGRVVDCSRLCTLERRKDIVGHRTGVVRTNVLRYDGSSANQCVISSQFWKAFPSFVFPGAATATYLTYYQRRLERSMPVSFCSR
jgi:hypothetical protein